MRWRPAPLKRGACSRSTAMRIPPRSSRMRRPHSRMHAWLGIPAERIVNCWPLDRLLAWLSNPSRNVDSELIAVVTKSSRYGKPDGT